MAYLRENIKKLGFGLMRLPKLEGDVIDIEQTKKMVDLFMDAGFTYPAPVCFREVSNCAVASSLVLQLIHAAFFVASWNFSLG